MDKKIISYSNSEIQAAISDLLTKVSVIKDKIKNVVGIANGGLYISIPIAESLGKEHSEINIKFYNKSGVALDTPLVDEIDVSKINTPFLLIDDLIDSGRTINYFIDKTGYIQGKDFYIGCLFYDEKNEFKVVPDFYVYPKPDAWVEFPWEKVTSYTSSQISLALVERTPYLTLDKLKQLREICLNASRGPWSFDETETCQRIFSTNLHEMTKGEYMIGHPLQLAKCPKKNSGFAEYWFTENDLKFLISASKYMLPMIEELIRMKEEYES